MHSINRWGIAAALAAVFASPAIAQETTPAMVAAAEKEGRVVWYNSVDVKVAEAIKKAFNEKYPKIEVDVERTGSERVLQRVNQEMQAGIKNVDVVNSSDASHFLYWKQQKWLAAHLPPDAAKFDARYRDPDNMYFTWRASLCVAGYNTNLVKDSEAPKSYADLLDPKWKGKMVKAHPGYSGTALTGTFAVTKVLGWGYLERLSKQGVLQQQSTTATPKSLASGERAVMVDGNEYNMFTEIDRKSPVKIIYPTEGTPFVNSPSAIFAGAPHPNAARVFENFIFTPAAQQLLVNEGGLRSVVAGVTEPANRTPLKDIKLLPDDPEAMLPQVAEIKKKYTALFGS
ncbi:MAG: extracellular solute-binding protein [Usitatibacter sp.]